MYKHNDHYLHPAAFHCVNNSESKLCRLDFLVLRGRKFVVKKLLHRQKRLLSFQNEHLFVFI